MRFWQMTGYRVVLANRALDIYAHGMLRMGGINGEMENMKLKRDLKGIK